MDYSWLRRVINTTPGSLDIGDSGSSRRPDTLYRLPGYSAAANFAGNASALAARRYIEANRERGEVVPAPHGSGEIQWLIEQYTVIRAALITARGVAVEESQKLERHTNRYNRCFDYNQEDYDAVDAADPLLLLLLPTTRTNPPDLWADIPAIVDRTAHVARDNFQRRRAAALLGNCVEGFDINEEAVDLLAADAVNRRAGAERRILAHPVDFGVGVAGMAAAAAAEAAWAKHLMAKQAGRVAVGGGYYKWGGVERSAGSANNNSSSGSSNPGDDDELADGGGHSKTIQWTRRTRVVTAATRPGRSWYSRQRWTLLLRPRRRSRCRAPTTTAAALTTTTQTTLKTIRGLSCLGASTVWQCYATRNRRLGRLLLGRDGQKAGVGSRICPTMALARWEESGMCP